MTDAKRVAQHRRHACASVVRPSTTNHRGDAQFCARLNDISASARVTAINLTNRANELANQIADVNTSIVPAESGGRMANDLRDQRDRLITELGKILPVTVIDRTDGSDSVMIGGLPLVEGGTPKSVSLSGSSPVKCR